MSTTPYYRPPKRIVITGGPGAGKTALLEIARRSLCAHVEALPDAARVVLGGGFPRGRDVTSTRALERAVYHVQSQLEAVALANDSASAILCDRGTLDVLAYWPGHPEDFFAELGTSAYAEMQRYETVLHLRLGASAPREAQDIDLRLVEVWARHPRRVFIEPSADPIAWIAEALMVLVNAIDCPSCNA
jgi:predicted ATPase